MLQAITPQFGVLRDALRSHPLFAQTPPPAAAASDLHESAVRHCTADGFGRRHESLEIESCVPLCLGHPTICTLPSQIPAPRALNEPVRLLDALLGTSQAQEGCIAEF